MKPCCQYVMTILTAASAGMVFAFVFACLLGFWKGSAFLTVEPMPFANYSLVKRMQRGSIPILVNWVMAVLPSCAKYIYSCIPIILE